MDLERLNDIKSRQLNSNMHIIKIKIKSKLPKIEIVYFLKSVFRRNKLTLV
jgi:hypothetical protein